MGQLYFRYLFRNLLGPMILVTGGLTAIIWLTQSLRFVDMIVNRGLSVGTLVYLTALLVPMIFNLALPVAAFVAVIFAYSRLTQDSELVVLQSAGLSRMKIAAPALVLSVLVVVLAYGISLYALPASYRQFKELQVFIRQNYASVLLQEEVFTSPLEGLTVFIRERDPAGTLRGILVHDSRDAAKPVTMMADEGRMVQLDDGPRLVLVNGSRQEIDQRTGQLSLLHFDRYSLDLAQFVKAAEPRGREPEERHLRELFHPDDAPPQGRQKLIVEAHQRLTWPLYVIAMVVAALVGVIGGPFSRRAQWKRIVATCFVGLVIIGVAIGLRAAAQRYFVLMPLMYVAVLAIIALGLWQLGGRTRKASRA